MKKFIAFFLPLCMLFVAATGKVQAQATKRSERASSYNAFHESMLYSKSHEYFFKPAVSGDEKEIVAEITENEVEEDEATSSLRFFMVSNFFAAIYFALLLGLFCLAIKKTLRFAKRFSHVVSHQWFIVIRVIRI